MAQDPKTILCIACYFKGAEFMRECHRRGARVFLVTAKNLEHEDWPRDILEEVFFVDESDAAWNIANLIKGVSFLARRLQIDRIVPLDDFDLEKAAALREHLRVPGMGDTRTRYFRDKLSMRLQAHEVGILVPDFVHVLNYDRLNRYMANVPAPWVLKPRSQASSVGIKKIYTPEQLYQTLDTLGDEQSHYLLERFVPGDIYHVDAIVYQHKVVFSRVHQYMSTPWEVSHEGGIFRTHNVAHGSADEIELKRLNQELMTGLGLLQGVSHTEYIKSREDGQFYFLETSARVGGANIAEMLEASSGVNLWREWARLETLGEGESYTAPTGREDYSGIIISLARQASPDTSAYQDPEIVWRMNKHHHAGMIVASPRQERVIDLLDAYAERFRSDFFASIPAPDKPTS
ncbi:MAG TPA: ATP-grasp domain-containing protein [Calditrichia bacterium]|nr:ATP-grasp domain-containing protein [Calditrichota bacterium]HQU72757.1 ATP-grasp domain-containing protein [Calditrichia bacterium]HQV31873.1 ATP-grasp domain-containing protein [Calditrichia bacterium]